MEPVAIIGAGQTTYEGAKRHLSYQEVIFEAAKAALDDAGLKRADIDCVVLAAHDLVDGRGISSMLGATPAGAYQKDETRLSDDGALAVAQAYMQVANEFNRALVVSWAKCSEVPMDQITNLAFDPFFFRSVGLNARTAEALQAERYASRNGVSPETAAQVVEKNRGNAANNPKAHLRTPVTVAEVLSSPMSCYPLHRLDMAPYSDGACAVVLAKGDAVPSNRKHAWIKGIGWSVDSYYLGDKELSTLPSLKQAAGRAYTMAGIRNPLDELDVAEVHELTSYHEMMAYEALGFCKEGEGARLIEEGATKVGGKLPVNVSGGVLSSNPYTATGLTRVIEAYLQVSSRANGHQVQDARTALAHGAGGIGAQSNCVVILSGER